VVRGARMEVGRGGADTIERREEVVGRRDGPGARPATLQCAP
jgi:hypothetical protein